MKVSRTSFIVRRLLVYPYLYLAIGHWVFVLYMYSQWKAWQIILACVWSAVMSIMVLWVFIRDEI